ncbi:MAG: hypothetical protein QF609_02465, partial [Gammaproteobacteria bacterium]|nr:hypothetical protein [Gammaproteobacteria bacterium]
MQHKRIESVSLSDPKMGWRRHCGFLTLTEREFTEIQERLLIEQIGLLDGGVIADRFFPTRAPRSVEEFRERTPLTRHDDYADILNPDAPLALPGPPAQWAFTVHGTGEEKWIPYTARAFDRFLDNVMSSLILSVAECRGDLRIGPGDAVMYNIPPRPYLCGLAAFGMRDQFGLTGVFDPDASESMDFKERISTSFQQALASRVDIIISMTSVLLKVGEQLSGEVQRTGVDRRRVGSRHSRRRLNHRSVRRITWAKLKSSMG